MKNILIILLTLLVSIANSQIGINTNSPLGSFHVDGASDNNTPLNATMIQNDFYIGSDGKVGIGIVTPTSKLHIKSETLGNGFRLVDGTQSDGKILKATNVNGDAIWENRRMTKIVSAEAGGFNGAINSDMNYIYRKVTLEPGKWIIKTNLLLYAGGGSGSLENGFYARFSWAEYNGTNYILSNDATFGNDFGGPFVMRYGIANGNTIIQNNSNISKTYYLVNRTPTFFGNYNQANNWNDLGAGYWGETSIIAFPAF